MSITTTEYQILDEAFEHFDQALFGSMLPPCLITLNRKSKRNLGYYAPRRICSRLNGGEIDEISLNPDQFHDKTDKDIMSVLVHEMVHLWQERFAEPPRDGYHDREWGRKMKEVGLYPSNTGEAGGKETGQQMHHYIITGGAFDQCCDVFLQTHHLNWSSIRWASATKANSKVNYICSAGCGQKAWAKPNSNLVCGNCMEPMEIADL